MRGGGVEGVMRGGRRSGGRLTLFMLALAFLAAAAAGLLAHRIAFAGMEAALDQALIVNRRAIESEIERFRYLPRVLGEDVRIRTLIEESGEAAAQARANAYLERVARRSGATELYVLDRQGTTLAASNHREPGSFVGINYAFRPYFKDAVATGEGRYYAIGVTTGRPGYFLSSRIDFGGEAMAVVVAKVDLQPLERAWRDAGAKTAIADRHGVVILSGDPSWTYRPLRPVGQAVLERIGAERTYQGIDVSGAPPLIGESGRSAVPDDGTGAFIQSGDGRLYARFRRIDPDGWLILAAADPSAALGAAWFWALATGLAGLLLTGAVRYVGQRRTLLDLRLKQTEMLERMVGERTAELARENEIRRRAEADLRAAQEGLIHSEKMAALGRMSSAIVHEVSQPLAALEATLATAEAVAEREKAAGARERVVAARALIRRMQRMVRHLKGFARKDAGERGVVDVDEAIRNALDVVRPRARTAGVEPQFAPRGSAPRVVAVGTKVEQVLINLLINALDAVEGHADPAIVVGRRVEDGAVRITVADNGGGIAPEHLARVKEPFFSTKLSGEGLGLGLSISNAILADYGGRLDFETPAGGGTVAVVSLPMAEAGKAAAE